MFLRNKEVRRKHQHLELRESWTKRSLSLLHSNKTTLLKV